MALSIQVLIATMNQGDARALLNKMHIRGGFVVVNQITNPISGAHSRHDLGRGVLLNYYERGLSRSRNRAVSASSSDICVIADDDMHYKSKYEAVIRKAYEEMPDADIIAFHVDSSDPRQRKSIRKQGRLNRITSMKVASWQITFRRESIINSGITFDERFGTGTENYMGEENIFLYDCIRKGLKVYYCPVQIATLDDEDQSTWFNGYTRKYFLVKGAVFRRMSTFLWPVFALQFLIRKYSLYSDSISLREAIIMMSGYNVKVIDE